MYSHRFNSRIVPTILQLIIICKICSCQNQQPGNNGGFQQPFNPFNSMFGGLGNNFPGAPGNNFFQGSPFGNQFNNPYGTGNGGPGQQQQQQQQQPGVSQPYYQQTNNPLNYQQTTPQNQPIASQPGSQYPGNNWNPWNAFFNPYGNQAQQPTGSPSNYPNSYAPQQPQQQPHPSQTQYNNPSPNYQQPPSQQSQPQNAPPRKPSVPETPAVPQQPPKPVPTNPPAATSQEFDNQEPEGGNTAQNEPHQPVNLDVRSDPKLIQSNKGVVDNDRLIFQ